jgi:hypothetical protein
MSDPGSAQHRQHGEDNTTGDPALDAYAHSADQSMGYLETEQLGQTETYGETPHGAYEHGGAMNADADRYTPSSSPDQTRLPDESGQPGAGPWATQPPGSQPLGADEQAMPAEAAAWNPPAVSDPGASVTPEPPAGDQAREREAAATAGTRRTASRQGGTMHATDHATDTEQQTPRGRQQRTKQQPQQQAQEQQQAETNQQNQPLIPDQELPSGPQANPGEQQTAPAAPTSAEANRLSGAPMETEKRGRTRQSATQSEDTGQRRSEGDAETEQPTSRRSSTRTAKASASQEQPAADVVPTPGNGKATAQVREQSEMSQPAPAGGEGSAEETLQHEEEQELRPNGQPVGVQVPTSPNAGALREARIRVGNVIDRFASQIPYGEQFADEAKHAANQALDRLEAQAAERATSLRRDLGAQPGEAPTALA